MRTPYTLLSAIILLLGIAIGCTTKEINLITNIDFELTTSNAEGGFVKDSLTTNLVITPQSVAYPGFQYFTKYTITQGEGYFVAVDNTLIPIEEDIRLNLEDKTYATNWKYIGTTAGNHSIRIEVRDNYERYKEANLVYEIKPIEVLWEVSSPQTMAKVNDTIPLTLLLENLPEVALTYERIIGINEGAGILLAADKKPITLNTPTTITAGTQTLHYISTAVGSNRLQFDLIADTGTEKTTAISFDIQEILVNKAPTIVPDEAETLATIAVAIPVLDNDTDPEEDTLTILAVMPPTNGMASIENNEILYTPNDAFIGKEVFTYTIMDSAGNEMTGGVITIVVSPRATIDIPDENFEQALIAMGHDEGELDGKMFQDVAERITSLEVSGEGIKRLEGIAWFTNLKELIANNNSLTSIDLTNNTALTFLNIEFNEVNSIDLTKNTKLIETILWDNNLSKIDLTKNVNLEKLDLTGNPLTEVDISNNAKLSYLNAGYTNMESIDVSNNLKLEFLNLGISPLRTLDVSMLLMLESLALWNTNLSELDVSNNTNLNFLAVSQGDLTGLDVSKNNRLERLWVVQTNLSTIDLSQNTSLTDLRLDQNALMNSDVAGLHKLEKLDITGNSNLSCIQVNDVVMAEARTSAGDWQKDTAVGYSTTCP